MKNRCEVTEISFLQALITSERLVALELARPVIFKYFKKERAGITRIEHLYTVNLAVYQAALAR